MFLMRKPLIVSFFLVLFVVISGCEGQRGPAPANTPAPVATGAATHLAVTTAPSATANTPAAAAGTTAPSQQATPAATAAPRATTPPTLSPLSNNCSLINSSDLASLFSTAETQRPKPVINRVDHPFFSGAPAAGTETGCTFYTFHQPGSKTGFMLQFTYWLDIPAPAAVSTWDAAWTNAKGKSGQPVSGLGSDAFINNGRLVVRKGNLYLTFEATGTNFDPSTTAGANRQIEIEKQLAQAAISRLQ